MKKSRFFVWGRSTQVGHIVIFEIIAGLPASILFSFLLYAENSLTPTLLVCTFLLWMVGIGVIAMMYWYRVTGPQIKNNRE